MSTKLKKDPIGIDALEEYLNEASDFSFELRILKKLTEMGISCDHGGQYRDPDTKKYREFDLRVSLTQGAATFVAAIECKSIGLHFPLQSHVCTVGKQKLSMKLSYTLKRNRKMPVPLFISRISKCPQPCTA